MSFDPKIKEMIIQDMCRTMRHDYDLEWVTKTVVDFYQGDYDEWEMTIQGMRPEQKTALYNQMKQVFENCIEKYFSLEIS